MRKILKKQISDALETMLRATELLKKHFYAQNTDAVEKIALDLFECAENIYNKIDSEDSNAIYCKEKLIHYMEKLAEVVEKKKNSDKEAENILKEICAVFVKNIREDKFKIVFMPYKADMWKSMETIWEAAQADDDCDAKVVPIPYCDITDPKNISYHYEQSRFPENVECIHYDEYSELKEHPDAIVIHNPYDDANNMTRVPERFYSSELKKHTRRLIYSPYFTLGAYKKETKINILAAPATLNADLIICQSKRVKQIYEELGYPSSMLMDVGSPKIDAIVNRHVTYGEIPKEWHEKIGNKKVFLLNTHLSYFPTSSQNTGKTGDYAVRFHNEIANAFLNRDDCALIWRPHPLLKNMLEGRFPQCLKYVNNFEKRIREASNGLIDEMGDYSISFACSDALVSTWSSLINEYMITKKPVMVFQTQLQDAIVKASPVNGNVNYFRFGPGAITFEEFRDNVIKGIDPKYDQRMEEIMNAFPNLDGTAGMQIYNHIKYNL